MTTPDAPQERLSAESVAPCCAFQTTPGRAYGSWTNCIHGLVGRRNELLRELEQINDAIWRWEVENGRTGVL